MIKKKGVLKREGNFKSWNGKDERGASFNKEPIQLSIPEKRLVRGKKRKKTRELPPSQAPKGASGGGKKNLIPKNWSHLGQKD